MLQPGLASERDRRLPGAALLVGLFFFLTSSFGTAATVSVTCPGGTPGGTYPSIGAALAFLSGTPGPHTINVTGTCSESNSIQDFVSLTIQAPSPGAATIATPAGFDAFDVTRSRDVRFRFLNINGSSTASGGITGLDGAEVIVDTCTVSDHVDIGVYVDADSRLTIQSSTIQNNGDGVDVLGNSTASISNSTIQNNAFEGVFVQDRSSVSFSGNTSISGNGDMGVFLLDLSRVTFSGRTTPTLRATTIENNAFGGILAAVQSVVRMGGPHKVRNNGVGCGADPSCPGVYLIRNSTFRGSAGLEISNNVGAGLLAEQGVDVAVNDAHFTNNTGDGLKILRISNGNLISGNTFSGNGGASFSCDATSLVSGDITGITHYSCKQIERVNGPPRPGKF